MPLSSALYATLEVSSLYPLGYQGAVSVGVGVVSLGVKAGVGIVVVEALRVEFPIMEKTPPIKAAMTNNPTVATRPFPNQVLAKNTFVTGGFETSRGVSFAIGDPHEGQNEASTGADFEQLEQIVMIPLYRQ